MTLNCCEVFHFQSVVTFEGRGVYFTLVTGHCVQKMGVPCWMSSVCVLSSSSILVNSFEERLGRRRWFAKKEVTSLHCLIFFVC